MFIHDLFVETILNPFGISATRNSNQVILAIKGRVSCSDLPCTYSRDPIFGRVGNNLLLDTRRFMGNIAGVIRLASKKSTAQLLTENLP